MSKKSDRIMAGILFGGAAVGVIAFACWRMNVNSYNRQKYVAMYFEESKAAEESKKESEKAEEEAFWAMPSVVELTLTETETMLPTEMSETSTEAETEVMTEMSLPTETETSTECPTEPFIAPTTAIPIEEVQIITPTTNAPQIANLTAEEENLLMRIASCEAGNQGWQGMALVMNVVLNRRTAWGMSISDVIYAKGQFSVIGCDKWNNGFIATEAPIALQAIKDGWDGSQGALFFCAPSGRSVWMATTRQYLFTAYGHEFYR